MLCDCLNQLGSEDNQVNQPDDADLRGSSFPGDSWKMRRDGKEQAKCRKWSSCRSKHYEGEACVG